MIRAMYYLQRKRTVEIKWNFKIDVQNCQHTKCAASSEPKMPETIDGKI